MDKFAARRVLQVRGLVWRASAYPTTSRTARHPVRSYSTAQNVTSASFWKSLVPKPLRRENRAHAPRKTWLSKEWNPATFYIIIFLMIGSMSIQMISLRKNFEAYMRRSEVRISLLREVLEKVQNGEQVDVEKMLGTGDAEREAEWEQVINEIEKDNAMRPRKKQEKHKMVGPPAPVAESSAVPESKASDEPLNQSPKGRTANFF